MSGWDIDPAGVSTVLNKVGEVVGDGSGEGLSGSTNSGLTSLSEAMSASGSGVVSTAVSEFFDHISNLSQQMTSKTVRATVGCSQATQAYIDGDTEMAERAQSRIGGTTGIDL
ncbi:DUF6507 family protein [Nocardiopsis sp. RSe5-2]|uniref:DUF6507 family protein n=1 Tax=Nocardiopsis endophytica TaxID=3018445 RepID=A0ABT4TZ71_9ACTN|nr:DUF6507 family protein [Nocardiopsis endophytica]MDA2809706.1 DUF6507 family protein [Nocardiopsis endophytica]